MDSSLFAQGDLVGHHAKGMGTTKPDAPATRTTNSMKHLPAESFLRFLLGGVAFAAGLTGLLLVVFPGSTARYFSWGLEPEPLASLIGGSYVASTLIFGFALAGIGWRCAGW
jgi:hypothetical protein